MENKLAMPFVPTKALGVDEAARLEAAVKAATTDQERAELLREGKIRLLELQLAEKTLTEPETDDA